MATKENRTISQFKSKLGGGGARNNLFVVEMTLDNLGFKDKLNFDADEFQFMCKAAQLPAQTVSSIEIPFRGRTFKVAGDRTIDAWTVTIINDEDFALRKSFEEWSNQIASLDRNLGTTDPNQYMAKATVYQLGRGATASSKDNSGSGNTILATYEFEDIFPTSVSAIELSYDTTNQIEDFTVEFQVQSYKIISAAATRQG